MDLGTVREPARDIPVSHEADVVVAGGGTAGVAAAVCAARVGLTVVMVERTAIPGGMATHVNTWLNDFDTKGGFTRELLDHLLAHGLAQMPYYNPHLLLPYLDGLVAEAKVRPLYLAKVVAPMVDGTSLTGVILESKSGRTAVRAKVVIDATGDGDVAARAGAAFHVGRDADGACQAITLPVFLTNYTAGTMDAGAFTALAADAGRRAGTDYTLPYDHWAPKPMVGTRACATFPVPHVTGHDPLDVQSLSDALIALRRQAYDMVDTLKQHTRAFCDVELGPFAAIPGVRESRRIVCDTMVTRDDVLRGTRFPDSLFTVTQNIDIHRCTEHEPAIRCVPVKPYGLPYGALLPRGLDNLLVVGRCIGGDHEALASYRIMADCFAMGEAAAVAAHLAVTNASTVRDIPVTNLLAQMHARGYR